MKIFLFLYIALIIIISIALFQIAPIIFICLVVLSVLALLFGITASNNDK